MEKQWILAPGETKEALEGRKRLLNEIPLTKVKGLSLPLYDLYDLEVFLIYGKDSLFPWQGAVLWEYATEDGEKYPVIQLKQNQPQEELLAHELVHAVRFAFKEPLFEEMFAYQTSLKWWRRFFGPLFLKPWEATCFAFLCLMPGFTSIFLDSSLGLWTLLGAGAFLVGRLLCLRAIFALCRKNLEKVGVLPAHTLAVMLRLSDFEIVKVACRSSEWTLAFFRRRAKLDERFKMIMETYLTRYFNF